MVFERLKSASVTLCSNTLALGFRYHLIAGFLIRLVLILYGDYQDSTFDVKYTDIDYRVFTDAARHVVRGESPYQRHTYRYSPIIAWLMVPNVVVHQHFGKVLFSLFDVLIALITRKYVQYQLSYKSYGAKVSKYSALFWLYNPLSIVISTRGNADSVACCVILACLYFLQCDPIRSSMKYVLSGVFLGFAIHMRIYPVIFAFPMYLSLGEYKITRNTSIRTGLLALLPNRRQIAFVAATVIYFVVLTYGMYLIYGYKFLFETYIYHLFRKDTRHNFSVFFYSSYLTMTDVTFDLIKFTSRIFLSVILFLLSLAFGCDFQTLPFALFCQSAVLVIYNSVVTSQYFVWFLSLLPLIVQDIKASVLDGLILVMMWTGGQLAWLFYAYFLEYQNQEVFIILWVMCVFFFGTNVAVLYQLIKLYTPGHSFGEIDVRAKNK